MNRNGFVPIIIILIIVVLLAVGGEILYSTLKKPPPSQVVISPQPQPGRSTPTPITLSPQSGAMGTSIMPSSREHPAVAQFTNDKNIAAQSLSVVNTTTTFVLKDFPDARFNILNIVKATGGVPSSIATGCGSYGNGNFIFISKRQPGASPPGFCVPDQGTDGSKNAAVVIDMEIVNNGSNDVSGSFLRAFYSQTVDGKDVDRLAQSSVYSGGTGPFSSRRIYEIFNVPSEVSEIRLVFGNYGGLDQSNGEELFSRSESGFVINFVKKTISQIPG